MPHKDTFWMACDSTEELRAEYGPFHTRVEAEGHARKLGFGFLLRYEHLIGDNEEIQEVRCVFIELACGRRTANRSHPAHPLRHLRRIRNARNLSTS